MRGFVGGNQDRGRSEQDDESLLGEADAFGYRRRLPGFSTKAAHLSANHPDAQGFSRPAGLTGGMDRSIPEGDARRLPDLGMAVKSILGFWLLYIGLITLRSIVLQYPDVWAMLARRSCAVAAGISVTFLVYLAMQLVRHSTLRKKAILAGILCLPASLAFTTVNYLIFYIIAPMEEMDPNSEWARMTPLQMAFKSITESALSWYFLFAAWAAFYVALSYAKQLRAADQRASLFAREAQEAQLRALRYQINPHFLFNTLNSLSSLILSQKTDVAEQMLMNLSTFFRATLSADPTADVSLDEEIRFPDRLTVEIDVPDQLLGVRVPVLILQPVVENAVKYGVARSRKPVTVRISTYEEAGRLHVKVKDDGEAAASGDDDGGTGVGLRNVCDRLTARYGALAGCLNGADPDGGYTVHLYMPVSRDD